MKPLSHIQELTTLKTIAETLNQSNDVFAMLEVVLEKLLDVTGLTFGWIFLIEDNREYTFAADRNLPPGLLHNEKTLMQCGSCWCMDQYHDEQLNDAVNIISCRRLRHAREVNSGDTCGFTHHATVPLKIGEYKFGILNVGAANKDHFTLEELALLQSVAYQIGVAVERMRLHKIEQRRAELFSRLGHFSRSLNSSISAGLLHNQFIERAIELLTIHFDWRGITLLAKSDQYYQLQALYSGKIMLNGITVSAPIEADWLTPIGNNERFAQVHSELAGTLIKHWGKQDHSPNIHTVLATKMSDRDSSADIYLLIGCSGPPFLSGVDGDALCGIVEHIQAACQQAEMEETRRELIRAEERNRLARDLHDSVSQMLFSISMTAKGANALLFEQNIAAARHAITDMGSMSQEALKEMRSLILQLRPTTLNNGIVTALKEYGTRLGITVHMSTCEQLKEISPLIQETLWRIGQESLNNISKHAATDRVEMALSIHNGELIFVVQDKGCGMSLADSTATGGLGLSIMRERVDSLGGRLKLTSTLNEGTLLEVFIPIAATLNKREDKSL